MKVVGKIMETTMGTGLIQYANLNTHKPAENLVGL